MAESSGGIPVFIINLQHSVERKIHMQNLCNRMGLRAAFVAAVDGRDMELEKVIGLYSKEAVINTFGRELSRNEIACALSHKNIYQKLIDGDVEKALIFEDDIEFDESLIQMLDSIDILPSDWELILLGHHGAASRVGNIKGSLWGRKRISTNYKLVRPSELAYGTYGYLINRKGASKLLAELELIAKPVDHYTGDSSYINLYAVCPPVIEIHEDLSDNYHSMEGRQELQAEQVALENVVSFSWYKKMAIYLGLYHYLNNGFIIMSGALQQIMPLRKYN